MLSNLQTSMYFAKILMLITSILMRAIGSEELLVGGRCTTGGTVNLKGSCKRTSECPYALSNLRAGISPSVCYMENDELFICCPDEKRMSEIKCEEYFGEIREAFLADSTRIVEGGCYSRKQAWILNKISGGRDAESNEMSYTVALGYQDEISTTIDWKCSGILISKEFVLTASHCCVIKQPSHVLLGVKNLNDESPNRVEAVVEQVHIHPGYNRSEKYNDIALIKMDRAVSFSQLLYPACLPQPHRRLEMINTTLVAGWGRLEYLGKRAETLQITNLNRYYKKECIEAYNETSNALRSSLPQGFIKSQICAGDKSGHRDTCDGDSGGPLVVREKNTDCINFVVGVTSFGSQFCGYGVPAIYTNVQSYLDWIEDIVWDAATHY